MLYNSKAVSNIKTIYEAKGIMMLTTEMAVIVREQAAIIFSEASKGRIHHHYTSWTHAGATNGLIYLLSLLEKVSR
jgi:hypothetical protein